MTVKEAIGLLTSPSLLILRGSYSGKIYYNSKINTSKKLQKYEEYECSEYPIDVTMKSTENIAYPSIVIWFKDYKLCNKN